MNLPFPIVISNELELCFKNCYKSILIQPSLRTLNQWQVYLFPKSGVFKSTILTFFIYFKNFPAQAPQVDFQTGVFHPHIDFSTSKCDVASIIGEWNSQIKVYTLLNRIYDTFVDLTPLINGQQQQFYNMEAAKLLKNGLEIYSKKALELLPKNDELIENKELNTPKRWNQMKEKLVLSLCSSENI